MSKFYFDGVNKRVLIDPSAVTFSPQQLWTEYVDWVSISDNSKYLPAFESVMIPLDGSTMLGQYLFIRNDSGWRLVPPVASSVNIVINGSFYAKDSNLPILTNNANQETGLIINRSTLATTQIVNSSGGSGGLTGDQVSQLNRIESMTNIIPVLL